MKKRHYLLFIGLFFLLLSIILFIFLRKEITPTCTNLCSINVNYFDALKPFKTCLAYCARNQENISFSIPNQIFGVFVWIGILFIFLWLISVIRLLIKNFIHRTLEGAGESKILKIKKIKYLFFLGLLLIIISVFLFIFHRDIFVSNCLDKCSLVDNYLSAFEYPFRNCQPTICKPCPPGDVLCRNESFNFNFPNKSFIWFVWGGLISIVGYIFLMTAIVLIVAISKKINPSKYLRTDNSN